MSSIPSLDAGRTSTRNLTLMQSQAELAAEVVAELDRQITPAAPVLAGEVMEITGPALSLFRFATAHAHRPVVIDIPRDLCSPAVRGKLYDLLVAIEAEEITRASGPVVAPVLALHRTS